MRTRFSLILIPTAISHWIFYGLWIFPVIINAETWFFGVKYSGEWALLIHPPSGILGIVLGIFIIKQKRIAYYVAVALFVFMILNIQINHYTAIVPSGIGEWTGTAEGMERQVHFDWRTVETIWIVILTIPGVIIAYKFYEQIKLKY